MSTRRISFTIPERLYAESMRLVKSGYFANFSELVRDGLRDRIERFSPEAERSEWIDDILGAVEASDRTDQEVLAALRETRRKRASELASEFRK